MLYVTEHGDAVRSARAVRRGAQLMHLHRRVSPCVIVHGFVRSFLWLSFHPKCALPVIATSLWSIQDPLAFLQSSFNPFVVPHFEHRSLQTQSFC